MIKFERNPVKSVPECAFCGKKVNHDISFTVKRHYKTKGYKEITLHLCLDCYKKLVSNFKNTKEQLLDI